MQKKLIALALASLAGSAFAQSNVTLYGVVDLGQAWVKSSGADANQSTVGRLDSNSSYIGFKGVEDLGNGLKAVFQYESGFTADNSGALAGGRDTFIGLAGGFGTVAAGTLTHPLRAMGAKVELTPGAAGFGTMASVTGTLGGIKTGADDRATNAIAYISPSFSGFTAIAAYVNGEKKDDAGINSKAWQVAGQYENGPLFVGLGYHKANDVVVNNTTVTSVADPVTGVVTSTTGINLGENARVWRVAGVYTFPTNTKLTALYDDTKVENVAKRKAWSLGVAQGFGKNTIGVEYARAGKIDDAVDGKVDDSSIKILSVVYSYELSKRTLVHARYSKLDNDANVNANFYLNPVKGNGVDGTAGSNYSGLMVGIRHSF